MLLVSANKIAKRYGAMTCFENTTFQLHSGMRVGLIGMNGAGKTSLFKVVNGEEEFEGDITTAKNIRIARLEQDPTFNSGDTVKEALLKEAGEIFQIEKDISEVHHKMSEANESELEDLLKKLSGLEHKFETLDGDSVERRIDTILSGIGFDSCRHSDIVDNLSGGERNRLALARLLFSQPDVWLFDEPTNHLDIEGVEFLEKFILSSNAGVIIISHDRRFLDQVTSQTWEIENKNLNIYDAPYTAARKLREENRQRQMTEFAKQQEFIKKQEEYIRRYGAGQRAREAKGRSKRLSRLERITRPEDQARLGGLGLKLSGRIGNRVLEVNKLSKSFDNKKLFENVSFELQPCETLGIVGPNGAGKSTLINILLQNLEPDSGSFLWGETIKHGVMSQQEEFPDGQTTPFSFIRNSGLDYTDQEFRDTLGAMLFREDDAERPIASMSGGEKKRLMLTRLLLEGHNMLILDEPTNHLDVDSCEALELALGTYEGNIILISHDRQFLDSLADRILWIDSTGAHLTIGGYSEAASAKKKRIESARQKEKKTSGTTQIFSQKPRHNNNKSNSKYAKHQTEKLEEMIISIEEKIEEINSLFSKEEVYTSPDEMKKLNEQLESHKTELELLEEEYLTR